MQWRPIGDRETLRKALAKPFALRPGRERGSMGIPALQHRSSIRFTHSSILWALKAAIYFLASSILSCSLMEGNSFDSRFCRARLLPVAKFSREEREELDGDQDVFLKLMKMTGKGFSAGR
jgi:hypothetical protein